jgi:hypothetical protein
MLGLEAEEAVEKAEKETRDSAGKKKKLGQRSKFKLWHRRINLGVSHWFCCK